MKARFLLQRAALRLPVPRPRPATGLNNLKPLSITRSATTTKGDAPNASNVAKDNPQSTSGQNKNINESRAAGDVPQDTASVARPTEQPSSEGGQDEVQGSDPVKRDPNKPAQQKRHEVEKEGQKPLDPADK
ncbi:uncharacterized protein Z520_11574 [Fonsecaea multimorphosa CBS 102226]|uniref:Uncharacterized protein n=1 Tax=Fonsecaea multimorphosa CBS 102226 TaxID=1442371 RepID=A0A0D2JHN9_9EURO|nr:uncharacterized protein Z520_11574 [Fonsecaea multimorphosa CBS 102226]KIX92722.1 hypothetical protein Z520_11574 [Fonsecaea multimorphosa CBS 102226]OAL17964.1 hypothetical protein AYO22_11120 [Fonsecaea multimorphosa]